MRKMASLAGISSALLGAVLLAVSGVANATGIKVYSYAVKFICDADEGSETDTKVNIHNPSLTGSADYIVKIVPPDDGYYVLGLAYLQADAGTLIECEDFAAPGVAVATFDPTDFEGFLVVLSKKPLDVVGVYEVETGEETEDVDVVAVYPQVQTVAPTVWTNLITR